MKRPVVLRREAQSEFDDAANFYEERGEGLGTALTIAVKKVLNEISQQPNRYPIVQNKVREAPVLKFPFAVYYRIEAKRIVVIAVFHCSRDPQIWRDRAR